MYPQDNISRLYINPHHHSQQLLLRLHTQIPILLPTRKRPPLPTVQQHIIKIIHRVINRHTLEPLDYAPAYLPHVRTMDLRPQPRHQNMHLPTDDIIPPDLVPVAEGLVGEHFDAGVERGVLLVCAAARGLDRRAEAGDDVRLDGVFVGARSCARLGEGEEVGVGAGEGLGVELDVRNPRFVLEDCAGGVEAPERYLFQNHHLGANPSPSPQLHPPHLQINHRAGNFRTLGRKRNKLVLKERGIPIRLARERGQAEEILGRIGEAGEVAERGDAPGCVGTEEFGWDSGAAVEDYGEVVCEGRGEWVISEIEGGQGEEW